ncbi:MAG: nitroreductase family protein [Chloroflexota bacterium]|nr:nitroreductase family protein [Chloroflexota bacterium]
MVTGSTARTGQLLADDGPPALLAAIRERRSISKVGPERPPRELIEQVLEAATWAPNHRLTEPWRFIVIAGEARHDLGRAMARAHVAAMSGEVDDSAAEFARLAAKPLRAPVIIAVGVEPATGPKIIEAEEIAAGAAAVQNLLLAAHALGLGAMWRTGAAVDADEVKTLLGLSARAHLIGFVYLGYPVRAPPRRERTPAAMVTRWLGWEPDLEESEEFALREVTSSEVFRVNL